MTNEAQVFDLWRDDEALRELARPDALTTARYEPILRRQLGSGHIDLVFEQGATSCVIGAIRLHGNNLVRRERSPLIWPTRIASILGEAALEALEDAIVPWLRSLARARSMNSEAVRYFAASSRFEHARAAGFVGAAPLDITLLRMAPFVYAQRFARGASVMLAGANTALGQAILTDVAASIDVGSGALDNDAFARQWYGLAAAHTPVPAKPDILITHGPSDVAAAVVIDTAAMHGCLVDVPTPAAWDLLFSFDAADAPAAAHFAVAASEPELRVPIPLDGARTEGGCSGTIVLAVASDVLAMQGPDSDEIDALARGLRSQGFDVAVCSTPSPTALAGAQLAHIFGSPYEAHVSVFADLARQSGIPYVFDLAPLASDSSAYLENTFLGLHRSALDTADLERYLRAYEEKRLDPTGVPEVDTSAHATYEAQFIERCSGATALFALHEDLLAWRARLPAAVADRVHARGVFVDDEPAPAAIGHLVPRKPFALAYGPIGTRSHVLYAAVAARRANVPIVVAGPAYDADCLQNLRAYAPDAIVLADPGGGVISALYRRATLSIDAAPRPRTAAGLIRALACGALPVLAEESPLARLTGSAAPVFGLRSIDHGARTLRAAMELEDRSERLAMMRTALLPRRDRRAALGAMLRAYTRVATVV